MDRLQYYLRLRGKVRGPYTVEQLRRLVSRGQFSRMHQISTDKIEWSPATDLREVFSPQKASAPAEEMAVESPYAVKTAQPFTTDEQWFYASGQQKLGPVSRDSLCRLLLSGEVSGATLIWREGLPDWMPAESLFAEASAGRGNWLLAAKPLVIALVLLLLIGGGTAGTIYWLNEDIDPNVPPDPSPVVVTPKPPKPGTRTPGSPVSSTGEIVSVDLSKQSVNDVVNRSVGMVVDYLEIDMHDGVHHEKAVSQGSCFLVNREGYAITNRHVVVKHNEWVKASESGRIRKERDSLVQAYMPYIERKYPDPQQRELAKAAATEAITKICDEIATITPRCKVYFGKKGYLCNVRYISKKFDMAVIQIEDLRDAPWFTLRGENTVPKLTPMISLGFPGTSQEAWTKDEAELRESKKAAMGLFGSEDHRDAWKDSAFELTPTKGDISIIQEEVGNVFLAQHTATIRHGNSGGPLLFREGDFAAVVFGINTQGFGDVLSGDVPVYVAYPVAQMRTELEEEAKIPGLVWR